MSTNFDFQQITPWRSGGDDCPDANAFYEVTNPMHDVDLSDEALIRAADGYAIMMLDDPRPLPHTAEELERATRAVIRHLRARNQPDRLTIDLATAVDLPAEEDASGHDPFPASDGGGWPRDPE